MAMCEHTIKLGWGAKGIRQVLTKTKTISARQRKGYGEVKEETSIGRYVIVDVDIVEDILIFYSAISSTRHHSCCQKLGGQHNEKN